MNEAEQLDIETKFNLLLEDVVKIVVEESIQELEKEKLDASPLVQLPCRKQLRGRELIELYNEAASSPLSDTLSPISYNHFSKQL